MEAVRASVQSAVFCTISCGKYRGVTKNDSFPSPSYNSTAIGPVWSSGLQYETGSQGREMGCVVWERTTVTHASTHMQVSKVNLPFSQVEAIARSESKRVNGSSLTRPCAAILRSPPRCNLVGKLIKTFQRKPSPRTHTHTKRLLGTPPFHTVS